MTCRRVRFCETTSISPPTYSLVEEEKYSLWFHPSELKAIRSTASEAALRLYSKYDLINPLSYINIMNRTYGACVKGSVPSARDLQYLVHWTRYCDNRRGLERTCLPGITKDRMRRTRHHTQTVLEIQQRGSGLPKDKLETMIFRASETLSRTSMVHARVTGIADAAAAVDHPSLVTMMEAKTSSIATTMTNKSTRKRRLSIAMHKSSVEQCFMPPSRNVRRRLSLVQKQKVSGIYVQ